MLQLNNLSALVKKRKRVGRGGARGGTSGKGHKGQKARSGGYVRRGYEGGQTVLARRLPKHGFSNTSFRKDVITINIAELDAHCENGETITKAVLVERGLIKAQRNAMLKILGDGELTKKLVVHADAFSKSALKAISDRGGEAHVAKEN